jgi:hypothetical protein
MPHTFEPHHPSPRRKIKLKIMSYFSTAAKGSFFVHVYHAIHHNFATKTPRLHTAFSKTPSKTPAKQQKSPQPPRQTFSATYERKITRELPELQ